MSVRAAVVRGRGRWRQGHAPTHRWQQQGRPVRHGLAGVHGVAPITLSLSAFKSPGDNLGTGQQPPSQRRVRRAGRSPGKREVNRVITNLQLWGLLVPRLTREPDGRRLSNPNAGHAQPAIPVDWEQHGTRVLKRLDYVLPLVLVSTLANCKTD